MVHCTSTTALLPSIELCPWVSFVEVSFLSVFITTLYTLVLPLKISPALGHLNMHNSSINALMSVNHSKYYGKRGKTLACCRRNLGTQPGGFTFGRNCELDILGTRYYEVSSVKLILSANGIC